MRRRMLAKKLPPGCSLEAIPYSSLLIGHIEQCLDAAEILLDLLSPVIAKRCQWNVECFRDTMMLAVICHDIGKAGSLFQDMIHNGSTKQVVRHEVFSDWLVRHQPLFQSMIAQILSRYNEKERNLAIISIRQAILGHHLKWDIAKIGSFADTADWTFPGYHQDLSAIAQLVESRLGISHPEFEPVSLSLNDVDVEESLQEPLKEWVEQTERALTPDEKVWMASVRSLLMTIDMIGSIRADTRAQWLEKMDKLKKSLQDVDAAEILLHALNLAASRLTDPQTEISGFQERVRLAAVDHEVVLVESACGTGKTIAAYGWAQMTGSRYMFFAYPTTATVTQGYLDYKEIFGDEIQMLHSRREADLDLILQSGWTQNVDDDADDQASGVKEEAMDRLLYPVTFCTVDNVLGLLHNYRSSQLLFPVLLSGCVIFDEVHAYDEKLWQGVLQWIKHMPVPALIMTASLQPHRKKDLEEVCMIRGRRLAQIRGPKMIESVPKYNIQLLPDRICPANRIVEDLKAGHSVLVVLNTVERAREAHEQLQATLPDEIELLLYHSHFKYEDRVRRQRTIVDRLRSRNRVCIVCTQICEMSFDINVTRLYSELAPFPSIIQRLGRLLRNIRRIEELEELNAANAYFWMPKHYSPYQSQDELGESARLLQEMTQPCSQQSLRNMLASMEGESRVRSEFRWLNIHPFLADSSARDSSQATVDVIMAQDIEHIRSIHGRHPPWSEVVKKTMPLSHYLMPKKLNHVKKWRHVRVVDNSYVDYDEVKGGKWK